MSVPATQVARLPARIRRRDGSQTLFDSDRILSAIQRAGEATGEFAGDEARLLTSQVIKVLSHGHFSEGVPDIERIQDIVEQTLIAANHLRTARAYISYRDRHERLRADQRTLVDVASSVNEYLDRADWRVNANANQGYSLGGLILNTSGKMIANYWLSHVYAPEAGVAHREGDIHIHDLDMLAGYCAGWSLRTLLHEGLTGFPARSRPARRNTCHRRSARSSTSSGLCRTNGQVHRPSALSIPIWRRSCATMAWNMRRSASTSRN